MSTGSGGVEAGWYRQKDGRERYWDGGAWTDQYREGAEPPPDPADRSPQDLADDDSEEPEKSKGSSLWGVLGFLVVAIIIFSCCGGAWSDDDDEPSTGSGVVACEDAVEARIKNPSTADFSFLDRSITDTSISGEVTAQNDFGAEKTLRYRCSISDGAVTDVTVNEL